MARKIKCPKCKSINLVLEEHWFRTIEFKQNDGIVDMLGNLTDRQEPYKLRGICDDCNHEWTIKKATQITDVCDG